MDRSRRRLLLGTASCLSGSLLGISSASASSGYPSRPLTFICPWPQGGTADFTMRVFASSLAEQLKQQVLFRNIPGASGMVGAQAIASAKPDGYTIGQIPVFIMRMAQLDMVTFDPRRAFTFLARTSTQTFGIVVRADSPYTTLEKLVIAAQSKPGLLSYASAGIGADSHVAMERLLRAAGMKMRHVPYQGGAPALRDLLSGQVDTQCDSSSWAEPVKEGRLRLLAAMSERRLPAFPHVPTLREAGYDVLAESHNGIGAPAGLDPRILSVLDCAAKKAVMAPEFEKACGKIHTMVKYLNSSGFRQYVLSDYVKQAYLIKNLKLREQLNAG